MRMERDFEQRLLPPPRGLLITAQFMEPLEFWTPSFYLRHESQLQPWRGDDRFHRGLFEAAFLSRRG